MNLLIIILNLNLIILINGLVKINKNIKNSKKFILFENTNNIINCLIKEQIIYTIIWKKNRAIDILLEELYKNKMSVKFIDEVDLVEDSENFKYSNEPMILENNYYLGSFFEIYEIIFRKSL